VVFSASIRKLEISFQIVMLDLGMFVYVDSVGSQNCRVQTVIANWEASRTRCCGMWWIAMLCNRCGANGASDVNRDIVFGGTMLKERHEMRYL